MDWQLALQLMLCNELYEHSLSEPRSRICGHEIYHKMCMNDKYSSHSNMCETKCAFLKVWHSCSSCKTPRQVSPKTESGDTAALCCDKPVSYSGSVLPDFVLELCWDIAGLSQAALVSSTCTGGAEEMSRVWWSWAELNVCTRRVWGIRHLTSHRDMGTEGASIPEYETFCSETAQEQVLALQKYQAGWGPR